MRQAHCAEQTNEKLWRNICFYVSAVILYFRQLFVWWTCGCHIHSVWFLLLVSHCFLLLRVKTTTVVMPSLRRLGLCPFPLGCGRFSHSLLHRKREACYSNSGSWVVDGWLSFLQLFHCLPLLLLTFLWSFHHLFQSSTLLVLLPCSTSLIFYVFMSHVFSFSIFVIMFPSLTESSLPFIAYTFCVALSPWGNGRRPPSVVQ